MKPLARLLTALLALVPALAIGETLQIRLDPLLNARIVTVVSTGQLVPWSDALDGVTSGEATEAAAQKIGEPFMQALPDDGVFPATAQHPRVELLFTNASATGNQVRRSLAADEYTVVTPSRRYRQLWIFVMSGMGESTLHLSLNYADGTVTKRVLIVPDWYCSVSDGDARRINLATNLGKWSKDNHLMEKDHHYLHGVDLAPDSRRELVKVMMTKSAPGVLTLWGITGVTN